MSYLVVGDGFSRIHLEATLDTMWIGAAKDQGEMRAAVDLVYPERERALVLSLTREMQQRGQQPQVCMLTHETSVDIAVLFWLRGVGFEFVKDLVPTEALKLASTDLLADRMEVVATGESEFAYRELGPFLDRFHRTGRLTVSIVRPIDSENNELLWSAELSAILPDIPAELTRGR